MIKWSFIKNLDTRIINKGRLIIFIIVFVILLQVLNIYLNISSSLTMHKQQIETSNRNIADKLVTSYEIVIKDVKNLTYNSAWYDNTLFNIIRRYNESAEDKIDIQKRLDTIMLNNKYIYSSYLYMPKKDSIVITNYGSIMSRSDFFDQTVLPSDCLNSFYMTEPRLVYIPFNNEKKLIISFVTPIPLSSMEPEGILIANIDVDKLYYDINKKMNVEDNTKIYIVKDGNTIITPDRGDLFEKEEKIKKNKNIEVSIIRDLFKQNYTSYFEYQSEYLGWKFIMETNYKTNNAITTFLYWAISISLILLISAAIVVAIMLALQNSIKKMTRENDDKMWSDFLIGDFNHLDKIKRIRDTQLKCFDYVDFCVLSIQFAGSNINKNLCSYYVNEVINVINKVQSRYCIHMKTIIPAQGIITSIISFKRETTNFDNQQQMRDFANVLYESVFNSSPCKDNVYIGIGSISDNIDELPIAYHLSLEALNYKIINTNQHILKYKHSNYSVEKMKQVHLLEHQLINNIIIANQEKVTQLIDEYFNFVKNDVLWLNDYEALNLIKNNYDNLTREVHIHFDYQIMDELTDLSDVRDLYRIKLIIYENINNAILKINNIKSLSKDDPKKIIDYINKNHMKVNFSLESVSDEFGLSKVFISKFVKLKTGKAFIDYINEKRISYAKEFLLNTDKTVEDISMSLGFNYSYYFIKVFKKMEGVTPGMYRANRSAINYKQQDNTKS